MSTQHKRGREQPGSSVEAFEEGGSIASHDSRDADDFALDLLGDSDDDSSYQPPEDELALEEEETLEDASPFTPEQVVLLQMAHEEVSHRTLESSSSSDDEPSVEATIQTANKKVAALPSTTNGDKGHKKPTKKNAVAAYKQQSILSDDLDAGRCVFFSIDLEHGGDKGGILQLSVEAFTRVGDRLGEPFNAYIKPPAGATIPRAQTEVHGLSLSDPRIQNAAPIEQVWPQFTNYIESKLENGLKKGIMVAWGGKACDCEWLFRVTEVLYRGALSMPNGLDFFLDPGFVISNYTSCRLNNKHTGLNGYGLEMTWCYVMQQNQLPDAHSSLADCKAQTDIVLDRRFIPYIDKYNSIVPMSQVWTKKREKAIKQQDELTRPVPAGWTEDDTTNWVPPRSMQYTGPAGGGEGGPSTQIKTAIARNNGTSPLANLFFFLWPLNLLTMTATNSEKYGRGDWVKETARTDGSGNQRKRPILLPCLATDPDRRHRHTDEKSWKTITVGYLLAFLSILMIRGAYGIRCATLFWEHPPDGISVPFVQNLMPRDNYLQMRRYIHFVDSESLPRLPSDTEWHPLQKIMPVLSTVQQQMQMAWTLGKNIVIDESMILYNGRAIQWVQYMPRKPIKHGIKVYALCCATTGVLVSFLVYTGKEYAQPSDDWTNIGVCDKLLELAGLLLAGVGRVLYTDNFYTSIPLMEHCYSKYGFLLVGTFVLSNKLSRTARDFPFHKLSNAAL